MGWLAPRFGVARLYVLGSVFVGISTVVFGLLDYISQPVPFLAWSLITRVAEAVGTSAAQTSARTIIINQFPERVNLAISIEEFMMGAGLCLGTALGGALYAAGGYGLPFYALGALFFFTAAASPALMPTVTDHSTEGSEKGTGGRSYREMLLVFLSVTDIWLIIASILVAALNWAALDPTMESYMHKTLGIEPAELVSSSWRLLSGTRSPARSGSGSRTRSTTRSSYWPPVWRRPRSACC
ncbi:MFS-type transporter SLC18B1 [Amphibalanus amphitrite]|uniref:MFS-type transporter SLC18B1 n=1 Tax=Amphibalanus amphitrite TaxID=1232801 RepID=A0A6A4X2G0_AMPAM|nr:MFS-type transporter SLC18B1 [Amphibalanus amphitrite]